VSSTTVVTELSLRKPASLHIAERLMCFCGLSHRLFFLDQKIVIRGSCDLR
jgi:hypothetical protein